ncbi:MAG: sensor histidine kinase [Anaerolineae bacterium]|nr:MAG: sensor histidine kinase [Anaerolineae bacterium]
MFSSLRSRLWLTYALLIGLALGLVMLVLIVYLLRNPLLYRQSLARLRAVETVILTRREAWGGAPEASPEVLLERADETFQVRIVLFSPDGDVLYDTRADVSPPVAFPRTKRFFRSVPILRDAGGKSWLYTLHRLEDGTWLMIATPRPNVPVLAIVRDELFWPFMAAGAVALLLSLLLAYLMARWIADPLQPMIATARRMPADQVSPIPVNGPREVRALAQAFNRMVERVQSSQRSQRDFVANVSHELKTPLTSIQGFAQAIMDGTADTPERRRQAAEVIYEEAARMHRTVVDLLDLARFDAGTIDFTVVPVDVTALLHSVVERFAPQAEEAGVTLRVEAESTPPVMGDGDRLAQVFTNLVDNALRHTPRGGEIVLTARPVAQGVEASVRDNGPGIPPDVLPHIFERFYRGDKSRPGGKGHGAGLGLAIAREIVQAHGGRIGVRSQPGQGATFTVYLPAATRRTGHKTTDHRP